jgi:hypothetical protein
MPSGRLIHLRPRPTHFPSKRLDHIVLTLLSAPTLQLCPPGITRPLTDYLAAHFPLQNQRNVLTASSSVTTHTQAST